MRIKMPFLALKTIFLLLNALQFTSGAKHFELKKTQQQVNGNDVKNQWTAEKTHGELVILKPDFLKVLCKGKSKVARQALGQSMLIPQNGMLYFEIKILVMKRDEDPVIDIELWSESSNSSYTYSSSGKIIGHNIHGLSGFPTFGQGDTVGIGTNLNTMEAIYTKNGQPLMTNGLLYISESDLFPRVTLYNPGDVILANFGPHFMHNFNEPSRSQKLISNAKNDQDEKGEEIEYRKQIVAETEFFYKHVVRIQEIFVNMAKVVIKFLKAKNENRHDEQAENIIKELQTKVMKIEEFVNKFGLNE
ncbi:hypothetical protein niasHT_032724 [Heterodera trifolii]|uniref:B30.2/SPRY domain-containing protein n=1 Tax=Heterodera trifolii TaxID=157864 RepID=A0ABD2IYB8_9BILA